MRITFLILLVLVVGLASAQDANRRARLRSLINRARKGDAEARTTLKELRQRLKLRRNEATESKPAKKAESHRVTTFHPTTATEPTTTTPIPTTTTTNPPQIISKQADSNRFPLFETREETIQRFRPRARVNPEPQPQPQNQQPHRAINRGLEVSGRSEQVPRPGARRDKEKAIPVGTIRRYAYFDDAGNYIFGYEAADGSFKEEIRGKDCVVKGKYGYIDPDGIRREYSYVSGNRCDPNAPENAELVEAPPLNDQFLHQTQSKKLTEAEMDTFRQQRRRKPVSTRKSQRKPVVTSRVPVRVVQQAVQPVQSVAPVVVEQQPKISVQPSSSRFPPFPGVKSKQEKPKTSRFPPFPGTQPKVEPKEVPVQPEPAKPIAKPPPPPPPPTKPPQVFAPLPATQNRFTPARNQVTFDFDKEFDSLFTNFPATRNFHQPTVRPPVVNTFPTPAPAPAINPFASRDFSQLRSADPSEPHQLVYDAASRTFKTVPLKSLVTLSPQGTNKAPSFTQFQPRSTPAATKPKEAPVLSKPKSSPLPSVPLGGLSFGGPRNKMSAKEFDDFFRNIELIVKTKPI